MNRIAGTLPLLLVPGAAFLWIGGRAEPLPVYTGASKYEASRLAFRRSDVGPAAAPRAAPKITNVQIADVDGDGRSDVLACDARESRIYCYRRTPSGGWEERLLASDLPAPAHAAAVDFDGDSDTDIIVSVLGTYFPSDDFVGRVVLLERRGEGFVPRTLLDDVRRVADAQPGDFDEDGDVDLAVAVFGYAHGQVLWLENQGGDRFREQELLAAPGTIHVPVADFDGDGDLDIAAVSSQEEEEIWGFENTGGGRFRRTLLHATPNHDIGSAGLVAKDLDTDGDVDLIWPVGDNLEDRFAYPQPYHGCFWFENQGRWRFERHRIGRLGGTYAADSCDLDGDGDQDVVLVSMCNDWHRPDSASVVWLENDGRQNFRPWQIDDSPTHLVTVACGDVDGDRRDDIVAGGLHLFGPFDRMGRISLWSNDGG